MLRVIILMFIQTACGEISVTSAFASPLLSFTNSSQKYDAMAQRRALKELLLLQWFVRDCCYPLRHFLTNRKIGTSASSASQTFMCNWLRKQHHHFPPNQAIGPTVREFKCWILVGQFWISSFFSNLGHGIPSHLLLPVFLDLLFYDDDTRATLILHPITGRHRGGSSSSFLLFFPRE